MKRTAGFKALLISVLSFTQLYAQKPLPDFELKQTGKNSILISWRVAGSSCKKLSVQRSSDLQNFKTIITAKKPGLINNDCTDFEFKLNKIFYYRIQYVLKNGKILYSKTRSTKELMPLTTSKNIITDPKWKSSAYVFTNNEGWVEIRIPDDSTHAYSLKFLEEDGKDFFQIKKININHLILDKTNFYHNGWFLFELYKDNILIEKNKVFISPD